MRKTLRVRTCFVKDSINGMNDRRVITIVKGRLHTLSPVP